MAKNTTTFEKKAIYACDLKAGDVIIVDGRHTFTVASDAFRVGTSLTYEVQTKEIGFIRFEEFKSLQIERPVPTTIYKVGTVAASDGDGVLRIRMQDGWHYLYDSRSRVNLGAVADEYWTDERISQAIKQGNFGFRIVFEPTR